MQVHIALGFFALFWRLPRVMRVLQRTPYLTWWVSLLFTASYLEIFTYGRFSMCLEIDWTLGVMGCVVSVFYVLAWLRSFFYPLRQEVRAHRMVWLFPLTFMISYGPYIFSCDTHSTTFVALNGFLNVLLYRCNSRFLGTAWPDMTDAPLTQWLGPSSRPVTVIAFPEVVTVLAEQRDALQESERQIVQLAGGPGSWGQKRAWTEAASSFATRSNVGEDAQIVSPRTGCVGGCEKGGVTAHSCGHSVRCLRQAQGGMHARLCECRIVVHQGCVRKFSSQSFPRGRESLFRVSKS